MVTKVDILSCLESMRGKYDNDIINKYYEYIESLDDAGIEGLAKSEKLQTKSALKRFAKKKVSAQKNKFTKINELVSYGITGRDLHIHVIPNDLHDKLTIRGVKQMELRLIEALEQIKDKMQDEKCRNVTRIFAGSYIITGGVATILKKLKFDVKSMDFDEAQKDKDLKWLCKRFKDKNPKKMGRAILTKEQILSPEWSEAVQERKKKLRESLGLGEQGKTQGILADLQSGVNPDTVTYDLNLETSIKDRSRGTPTL